MFQFPRLSSPGLCVRPGDTRASSRGFAHSGTPGSRDVCSSPGTIAACRALLRLPVPRHPPCAHGIFPAPRAGRHVNAILKRIQTSGVWVSHTVWKKLSRRSDAPHMNCEIQICCRLDISIFSKSKLRIDQIASSIFFAIAMRLSRYAGVTPGPDAARVRGGGEPDGHRRVS